MTLKKQLQILVLLVYTLGFNSCVIRKSGNGLHIYQRSNKLITSNGYIVAKPLKFNLKGKFDVADSALFSTEYLYIRNCSKDNSFFKFYKNGKVIFGSKRLAQSEVKDTQAQGGYYQITGTSIKIEISYTQKQDQWNNLLIEGKIFGDTLKFYKDRYNKRDRDIHHFTTERPGPDRECLYYVLSKDSCHFKTPDW